jgi:hypothetical protein
MPASDRWGIGSGLILGANLVTAQHIVGEGPGRKLPLRQFVDPAGSVAETDVLSV